MSTSLPLLMLLALSAPAPAAHVRPSELGGDWPAEASGRKVTVEAKTPNQALREIAGAAGWGLALNSGPAGDSSVEFSFKDVPAEDALAAVLYAAKLHAVRIGDSVAVTPRDFESGSDGQNGDDTEESEPSHQAQSGGTGGSWATRIGRHRHRHHANGKDRVEVGHDVDIPAGAQVGEVVAIGGSVHIGAGASTDEVVAIGGHIETESGVHVGGDAVAIGGSQHLGPGTIVSGDAVMLGGELQLDPGATVNGQQVNLGIGHLFELDHPAFWAGGLFILFWVRKLAEFVLFFCLGALLLFAVPNQLATVGSLISRQPLRAGLAGFLATLAIPFLTLLLIVTLVGIPLVAVEFFGVALAALMGFTAISVLVGNRLRIPVRGGGLLGLAIGTAIVVTLTTLPWVGGALLITAWFVALGAALVTRFGSAA
jgi:hypothetical protein